ncbi:MAG: hypothetical protein HYT87_03685 [Nitrospirae bacterium]|nr:hypothetical protein [Nitrospirota bacterium]
MDRFESIVGRSLTAVLLVLLQGCRGKTESGPVVEAKKVVSEYLKAPSTARWVSASIADQAPPQYIVHVVVDAQNSFGAMIRNSYCVYVRLGEGGKLDTSDPNECSTPPTPDELYVMKVGLKALGGVEWGK